MSLANSVRICEIYRYLMTETIDYVGVNNKGIAEQAVCIDRSSNELKSCHPRVILSGIHGFIGQGRWIPDKSLRE